MNVNAGHVFHLYLVTTFERHSLEFGWYHPIEMASLLQPTVRHGVGGGCVTWSYRRGHPTNMHGLTPDVAGSPLQMFAGSTLLFSLGVGVWASITNPKKTRFRWFVSTQESQKCWFTTPTGSEYSLVILGPGGGETNPGGLTACSRQSCWGDVSCSTMS